MLLTYDEIRDLARRTVQVKGRDHKDSNGVDMGCTYFYEGEPSCLVGHMLYFKGMSASDLAGYQSAAVGDLIASDIISLEEEEAGEVLTKLQSLNDQGASWGVLVDAVFGPEPERTTAQPSPAHEAWEMLALDLEVEASHSDTLVTA